MQLYFFHSPAILSVFDRGTVRLPFFLFFPFGRNCLQLPDIGAGIPKRMMRPQISERILSFAQKSRGHTSQ
jgi:hypothetical protein